MTDLRRMLVLCLLAFVSSTAQMGTKLALPLFAIELGASAFLVGLLVASFSIFPALLSIHAGRWMDRSGRRTPMLICMILMTAASLAVWWQGSLWMLFLANAMIGFGFNTFYLAITAAFGTIGRPEDRAKNFSWLALTGAGSAIVGPVLAGQVIDPFGHAVAMAVLATMPAACGAIVLTFPRRRRVASEPKAASAAPPRHAFDLLRLRPFREVIYATVILGLSWDVFTFVVPLYGTSIGLSAGEIGNIIGAFGLASLVVRSMMPVIVRRVKEWTLTVAALALSALVFFAFPFIHSSGLLFVLTFAYGIAWGGVQPMLNALVFATVPQDRVNEALGVRTTIQNSTHATIPAVFGLIGAALGTAPVFLATAILLSAGGWAAKTRWSRRNH